MVSSGWHRALVRLVTGELQYRDVLSPPAEKGDAVVQIRAAGVCGTDLQILSGDRNEPAMIIGHEGVGTIIAYDGRDDRLRPGRHVVFNPTNFKDQARILGHSLPGTFQEQVCVREIDIDAGMLVAFDEDLPLELGPMAEPLAIAMYAWELVQPFLRGGVVLVCGAGSIGLCISKLAPSVNGLPVLMLDPNGDKMDWLVRKGLVAAEATFTSVSDLSRHLERYNLELDSCFIVTPKKAAAGAIRALDKIVRPDGCIDVISPIDPAELSWIKEAEKIVAVRRRNVCGCQAKAAYERLKNDDGKPLYFTSHRGASEAHLRQAVSVFLANGNEFKTITTHWLRLQEAGQALNAYRQTLSRSFNGAPWIKMGLEISH